MLLLRGLSLGPLLCFTYQRVCFGASTVLFCYHGSVVYLEIRCDDPSGIALFPENCKFR